MHTMDTMDNLVIRTHKLHTLIKPNSFFSIGETLGAYKKG